ncbi:unnamed protein product [Amoebophrya sp. A120]|nr:unnamed protein product [Amoebophrya sp. A120]|eukprot:GSA120T00018537001.1
MSALCKDNVSLSSAVQQHLQSQVTELEQKEPIMDCKASTSQQQHLAMWRAQQDQLRQAVVEEDDGVFLQSCRYVAGLDLSFVPRKQEHCSSTPASSGSALSEEVEPNTNSGGDGMKLLSEASKVERAVVGFVVFEVVRLPSALAQVAETPAKSAPCSELPAEPCSLFELLESVEKASHSNHSSETQTVDLGVLPPEGAGGLQKKVKAKDSYVETPGVPASYGISIGKGKKCHYELRLLYEHYEQVELDKEIPYVAGYLAFREVPHYEKVLAAFFVSKVATGKGISPQNLIVFVDGNGRLHPNACGAASHLGAGTFDGLLTTIGVAKNLHSFPGLRIQGVAIPHIESNATMPSAHVLDAKELRQILENRKMAKINEKEAACLADGYPAWVVPLEAATTCPLSAQPATFLPRGLAVAAHGSKKPIFVSVGHRISLRTSLAVVSLFQGHFRIPIPTRVADLRSRKIIEKEIIGSANGGTGKSSGNTAKKEKTGPVLAQDPSSHAMLWTWIHS